MNVHEIYLLKMVHKRNLSGFYPKLHSHQRSYHERPGARGCHHTIANCTLRVGLADVVRCPRIVPAQPMAAQSGGARLTHQYVGRGLGLTHNLLVTAHRKLKIFQII